MMGRFAGFGVLTALVSCAGTQAETAPIRNIAQPVGPTPAKQPAAAMFGALRVGDSGDTFRASNRIELVAGNPFGWRIQLPCTGPVEFREMLKLPVAGDWPTDMSVLPGTTISPDGRIATTRAFAPCVAGWIEHGWTVAAGDPPGDYVVTVDIDGYERQTWHPVFSAP